MRRYSPPDYSPPRRGYDSPARRGYDSPARRGYDSPPRRGYDSPPRRGYGSRARSPPRRGHGGGGYGRNKDHGSLLVRNIPLSTRPDELRVPFERFGVVRDVYIPKDYYTGEPRGFAFVEFMDPYDAAEAQYYMNRQIFAGRELTVIIASESRKRPDDMRRRTRTRGSSGYGSRRSHYGRSHSPFVSRSPSPRYTSGSRSRHRSRSPRRRGDHTISPDRRHSNEHVKSPRESPKERDHRSYSPGSDDGAADQNGNGYKEKTAYESNEGQARRRSSPEPASRSLSGSRFRSKSSSRSRSVD